MIALFNLIFVNPLFNLLVFFYNLIPGHDLGLAIIAVTIVIRLILYPLSWKSLKAQKAMKDIQPQIDALKLKYKGGDQKQLGLETMALYKQANVNPFSSCFLVLLQLPFLIGIYQVFRVGLTTEGLNLLYPFFNATSGIFTRPEVLNEMSFAWFGFAGFSLKNGAPIFAILAGAAQFWQSRMLITTKPPKIVEGKEVAKDENMMAMVNKQMLYTMPLITVFIGWSLPGGLSFYWFISTLLTVAQQAWLFKKPKDGDINSVQGSINHGGSNGAPEKIGLEGKILEGEIVK